MKFKEYIPSFLQSLKLRFNRPYNQDGSLPTVPIVVSLTSIPSRLGTIHLTIRSLLAQSVVPKKIILWLHRSEEHTSELQSRPHLVCRLLLEKKKKKIIKNNVIT